MVSNKFAVVPELLLGYFHVLRTGNPSNAGMTLMLAISKLMRLASADYVCLTQ